VDGAAAWSSPTRWPRCRRWPAPCTPPPEPLTFGVTGSSGKTSTKDLLAQVLGDLGPDPGAAGLVQQRAGPAADGAAPGGDTRFAALEYSARGVGHIAFLCGIVAPHVAWCSTSARRTWASSAAGRPSHAPRASSWTPPGCAPC
jgi:hypothetical protein